VDRLTRRVVLAANKVGGCASSNFSREVLSAVANLNSTDKVKVIIRKFGICVNGVKSSLRGLSVVDAKTCFQNPE